MIKHCTENFPLSSYYSDYLNVGYAYHWITPPESVYPFDTSFDGISYVYQDQWGSVDWSTELFLGATEDYFPIIKSGITTRNNRGIALNVSPHEAWSLRAMILRTIATYEVDALSQENMDSTVATATDTALNQAGLSADVIAAIRDDLIAATSQRLQDGSLDLEEVPVDYADLAIRYETKRWFLMNEIIAIPSHTYLYNNLVSNFITGGVRFGDALLHLTLTRGRANPHDDVAKDRVNTTPANLSTDAVADVLASQIRTQLAAAFLRHQESVSVGMRYETSANTAVKFEITRFEEIESFEGDEFGVGTNTLFRAALNATF